MSAVISARTQKRPVSEQITELLDPRAAQGSYITASYLRLHNPDMLVTIARGRSNPETHIKYLVGATARTPYDPSWLQKLGIKTGGSLPPMTLGAGLTWPSILKMLGFVSVAPRQIDYGVVSRDTTLTGLFKYHAASDGFVSASFQNNNFKVVSLQALSGQINVSDQNGHKHVESVPAASGSSSVQVRGGQEVDITISINVDGSLADGIYADTLALTTPDGKVGLPAHFTLTSAGQLFATPSTTYFQLLTGQSSEVDISFINNGEPTDITAVLTQAPAGVSVDPLTFHMNHGEQVTAALIVRATSDAPWTTGDSITVSFAAFGQPDTAQFTFSLDVIPPVYEWDWHSEKTKITLDTSLIIQPNGDWAWGAHLYDTSTWYGDNYSLIVGVPYQGSNGTEFHYLTAEGSLGAKYSGGARTGDVNQSGNSPVLAQNYMFAIETGWNAHFHVAADLGSLGPDLVALAEKYGPAVATLAGL